MGLSEAQLTAWWGPVGKVPLVNIGPDLDFVPQTSDGSPVGVRVHSGIAQRLTIDLNAAWAHDKPRILRADSYNVRYIKGTSTWSRHARGLAVDLFLTAYDVWPPGGVWTPDAKLPETFYGELAARGLTLGRSWSRADWPHVQDDRDPSHETSPAAPIDLGAVYEYLIWLGQVVTFFPLGPDGRGPTDPAHRFQAVKVWQKKLDDAGYELGAVDGWYGSKTTLATRTWQQDQRMVTSGMVGGVDWQRLVLGRP